MSTVLRYAGECQFCARLQKIDKRQNLVHHGYERPGTGWIEGDCPGVGFAPYELSCEAIKLWLTQTEGWIVRSQDMIADRTANKLNVRAYRAIPSKRWGRHHGSWEVSPPRDYKGQAHEHEAIELHPDEENVDKILLFHYLNAQLIKREEDHCARLRSKANEYRMRIASWTLRPVITVEEMKRIEREKRAPLTRTLPKEAAGLGQSLAKRRKAKLTRMGLEQLLTAIGWKVEPALVPLKYTSVNQEDLPVVERLVALGVPFTLPTGRYSRHNYVSAAWEGNGEMVVYDPARWRYCGVEVDMTPEQVSVWRNEVVQKLEQLPSAPRKGPTAPFASSGLYVSDPRILANNLGDEVRVSNVWVIMPALHLTAANGSTFVMPEIYGVNYDMTALKPAGFYKWADAQGIREAIAKLATERA